MDGRHQYSMPLNNGVTLFIAIRAMNIGHAIIIIAWSYDRHGNGGAHHCCYGTPVVTAATARSALAIVCHASLVVATSYHATLIPVRHVRLLAGHHQPRHGDIGHVTGVSRLYMSRYWRRICRLSEIRQHHTNITITTIDTLRQWHQFGVTRHRRIGGNTYLKKTAEL